MKFPSTLILVILLLLAVITIQHCSLTKTSLVSGNDTVTKVDTVWLKQDTQYVAVPKLVYRSVKPDTIQVPDDSLRIYFNKISAEYYSVNVFNDTIVKDSSFVYLTDTISQNRVLNRGYRLSFSTPTITSNTIITKPARERVKVFLGGGIEANKQFQQVNIGVAVLNRSSSTLVNVYTGLNSNGNVSVGLNTYWKLSLKK